MAEVEKAVKRPHWEPRHEWESRVKFVEDNMADHGLEKAVALSIVWGNMMFMGCSYPPGTERLVKSYPLPPLEELKARRKAKESLKRRKSSDVDSESPTKRVKLEDLAADVSSLISSIRSQSEKEQHGGSFIPQHDDKLSKRVPQVIQTVANTVCLCKECIGEKSASERAEKLLEKFASSKDASFSFEFREATVPQAFAAADGFKCTLVINGETVVEKVTSEKGESKRCVAADVLKMADDWQEAHGKPACPNLAQHARPQAQQPSDNYGDGAPLRYGYDKERGRGNAYNQRRGNHYDNYQSPNEHRSRYNSSDYFMPPQQAGGRRGRGYGGGGGGNGRGGGGGGYQYGGQRYY